MGTDDRCGETRRREEPLAGDAEVLERSEGRSGELVLRRAGAALEIIVNGCFLISTANDMSSRAMITAALPFVAGDRLRVLIGGLGLGYALDEALICRRVAEVTVAEYEPTVVRWFREHGGERAGRAAAAEVRGRAVIVIADVADLLPRTEPFDLICLDTDNGPDWLVRDENAALYERDGIDLACRALRPGGAVVFWSPDRAPALRRRLQERFPQVLEQAAHDVIAGRRRDYVMYVAASAAASSCRPIRGARPGGCSR